MATVNEALTKFYGETRSSEMQAALRSAGLTGAEIEYVIERDRQAKSALQSIASKYPPLMANVKAVDGHMTVPTAFFNKPVELVIRPELYYEKFPSMAKFVGTPIKSKPRKAGQSYRQRHKHPAK